MVERFDRDCPLAHWLDACECPRAANVAGCVALIDQDGPDDGPKCGLPKASLHWCKAHTQQAFPTGDRKVP